jgi:phosphoesterase RecJ-like protein
MSQKTTDRARGRVARVIQSQSSSGICLGTHVRPDGDALGSLLGLGLALEGAGNRVAMLCADPVPENYRFLPGSDRVCVDPPRWTAQLGIVLDCDGISRLGPLERLFAGLPHLVDIDHHGTGRSFGEERLTDSTAGATSEIVYGLLRDLGLAIDPRIATCLYAGILSDTGRFCYGNTKADSLRIAADLVRSGADPHFIARRIYEERSIPATHLLGRALSRLSADLDSQIVSSILARQDFTETGAAHSDTEGIIDHLRAIGGPRVALLFVEVENGEVRVSLRSDGSVDVSEIALGFGGGGHAMAAGCTVRGSAEGVREKILAAVRAALPETSPPHAG